MENNARKWIGTAAMAATFLAAAPPAHAQSGRRVVLQVEYGVGATPPFLRLRG